VTQPSGFDDIRIGIAGALEEFLSGVRAEMDSLGSVDLFNEIEGALTGGKMIRPMLCVCGYLAAGGVGMAGINKAAASLELLHTFAILHDDIMDKSQLRRGKPVAFRRIAGEQSAAGRADPSGHGIGVAMLAGDLALALSDRLFVESDFEGNRMAPAWRAMNRLRLEAAAGQYLDLSHSGGVPADTAMARSISRLKTSSYSVEGPLLVGAALAGAEPIASVALSLFGKAAGEAFQLADDLAGLLGDSKTTGKDISSDLARGKPTALISETMRLGSASQRKHLQSAWGKANPSAGDLALVKQIVLDSQAAESIANLIEELSTAAIHAIQNPEASGLKPDPCRYLKDLAESLPRQARSLLETKA